MSDNEHDAWFRRQVEEAVRQADDPTVALTPHEQVANDWPRQRAALLERANKGHK